MNPCLTCETIIARKVNYLLRWIPERRIVFPFCFVPPPFSILVSFISPLFSWFFLSVSWFLFTGFCYHCFFHFCSLILFTVVFLICSPLLFMSLHVPDIFPFCSGFFPHVFFFVFVFCFLFYAFHVFLYFSPFFHAF